MRPLAVALLTLLLLPVTAAGKDPDAPARVVWNSTPDDVRAHGTWDARVSVLQGPGGLDGARVRPSIVVTPLPGGAERRVPMIVDVPPNTFRATVPFPRAGIYEVAVAGFDPRDPARFIDVGPPVRIEPAAPADSSWPWAPTVGAALAVLVAGAWSRRRFGRSGPDGNQRAGGRDDLGDEDLEVLRA
jgi:hypothetical protein